MQESSSEDEKIAEKEPEILTSSSLPVIKNLKDWLEPVYVEDVEVPVTPDDTLFTVISTQPASHRSYSWTIHPSDISLFESIGKMVRDGILAAFLGVIERKFYSRFVGFEDPSEFSLCKAHFFSVKHIRAGVKTGKTSLQILYNGSKHFVVGHYEPNEKVVKVYDSLGMCPTSLLRRKLQMLYGTPGEVPEVIFPSVMYFQYFHFILLFKRVGRSKMMLDDFGRVVGPFC